MPHNRAPHCKCIIKNSHIKKHTNRKLSTDISTGYNYAKLNQYMVNIFDQQKTHTIFIINKREIDISLQPQILHQTYTQVILSYTQYIKLLI